MMAFARLSGNIMRSQKEIDAEIAACEARISELGQKKAPLIKEKMLLQADNSAFAAMKKTEFVPRFRERTVEQKIRSERMSMIQYELVDLNRAMWEEHRSLDLLKKESKSLASETKPSDGLVSGLIDLHAKYERFSADPSRINSMRLIAAEIAADLLALIRKGNRT